MTLRNWFRLSPASQIVSQRDESKRRHTYRVILELLEDRTVPSISFNDPDYLTIQWGLNNTGQTGGKYDVDIDAPTAWSITTGSMKTVLAVLDDGIDYTNPDVYLNVWLNQGEIPAGLRPSLTDTDADGLITFRDLNAAANASFVTDLNANGYIDGGDLLRDSRWADGLDGDGNGKIDDLIGWDFQDNDNDPMPGPTGGHGTGMAQWIGAIPNNGIGKVGVNWQISMMPVRIHTDGVNIVAANGAAGLDYAVAQGASISNNSWGNDTFSQVMYDAIARAGAAGHLFVASAGNQGTDMDVAPRYPAGYDLDNIISATAINASDTMDTWNWGLHGVDLGAPTAPGGGTSGASAHTAGVAALLKTIHPDWNYVQLKDRILSTVEPSAALADKTVTGGRLNAAMALATTSISISDPEIMEGSSGTTQMVFTVTRLGDDSGTVTLNWSTANGAASAGSDYVAASGQVNFVLAGSNTQTISITIVGDNVQEADETLFLNLSLVSGNALLADTEGQGTILSDDVPISISDATTIEGDHSGHYRGAFVTGAPDGPFATLAFGPDGNLYTDVAGGPGFNTIRRYNGTTGAFLDTFVPVGPVNGVRDMAFRAGYLYVGSEYTDEVVRFNASTGAFVDVFVAAGSGGLDGPHGLAFGPDANGDGVPELYVSGRNSFNVVRYNGATGAPLGTYVTPGSGGLAWPEAMTFDPAGNYLFVASTGSNQILKYNSQTGAYLGVGASSGLSGPRDVKFGSDGLMYVSSGGNDRILRFTAAGIYVNDFVPAGSGGMDNPGRVAFGADGDLYVTALGNTEILRFGTEAEAVFTVSLPAPSSQPVTVNFATANGTAVAGSDFAASSGTLTFAPGESTKKILVPTVDNTLTEPTETFTVNLSNAVGGAIADGQGVGTILDNETKFYVVNDAAVDQTFEYASGGVSVESYGLGSGNTAPRGAASTAAGTKVWVVDASGKVYVYNPSGGLLGSWSAGGLPGNAQVEGIATNGTDIWLVDNKQDKVFKYTAAASRLSGSQSAASSFALNSANSNSKDLVTDGTSLWVVNDSTTDKVFKYTLAGALLGSWTIDAANASPTGITLDPTNVQHLWIVDSVADKLFQYDNAASRSSGSQNASTSFALAAGNTNPQGIADPPAAQVTESSDIHPVAFKISGAGNAPEGVPVFPGGTVDHDATGTATHLGKYTGEGLFTLDSIDFATLSGTFHGTFTFVAANGDKLVMNYGSGTFSLAPNADGTVVATFVAEFTPDPEHSTGRFAKVVGGSFVMVATSEPFVLSINAEGFTPSFTYSWVGDGTLEFATGKKK